MTDPTPGVDSYVSITDADAIAANRLFATAWTNADTDTRCTALRTATALLNRLRWQGRSVAHGQPLAWPRVPEHSIPGYPLSVDIPIDIATACVELAIHLLGQGQLAAGSVQMRMLGDSMAMYFPSVADELPKHVRRLIEPHLRVSSANVAEVWL